MEESRRLRSSVAQFDYLISLFPFLGAVLLEERLQKRLVLTIRRSPTSLVWNRARVGEQSAADGMYGERTSYPLGSENPPL